MALLVSQLSGFGIITFAKESRAIIDAMTVPPNMARRRLIDLTVRAFLGAALWPKIDVAWFLAAHDEQAGRINWKDPGNFTLTAVNSPTFTADRGFAGNGSTSYLDTGWDWGTNGVGFTQNNAHHSLYQRTSGNNNPTLGLSGGTSFQNQNRANSGTNTRVTVNNGTALNGPAGGSLPLQVIGRRVDATNVSIVRDGVEVVVPTARASSTSGSTLDWFCGRAGSVYSSAQVAGFAMGAYLDDIEALAYRRIWKAYMVSVGADT